MSEVFTLSWPNLLGYKAPQTFGFIYDPGVQIKCNEADTVLRKRETLFALWATDSEPWTQNSLSP